MPKTISLYCIPFAWLLSVIPRAYSLSAYKAHTKTGTKHIASVQKDPRSFKTLVAADKSLPPLVRDRILRAENAMLNGAENLGLFAAAVAVGNSAGLDVGLLNWLALVYVFSRSVYDPVYIYNDTARSVPLRSAVFAVGLLAALALFVCAGVRYNQGMLMVRFYADQA